MLVFRPDTHPETSDTELPRSAGDNAHPAKKKLTSNTTQRLVQASAKSQSVDTPVSEAPRGVSKAAQALALVNDSTKPPPKLGLVVNNKIESQSVDAPEPTVEEKPARAEPEPESEQKPDNKKQPASGFDAQSEYATELQSLPEMPEYLSETPPDDFVSIHAPQDSVPVNQNSSSELPKSPVEINSDSTITKGVTETEKANITDDQQDPLTLASLNSGEDWVRVVQRVKLRGMSKNILMQCAYKDKDSNNIRLLIDKQYIDLINATHQQRIVETLSEALGCSVNVNIEAGAIETETPAVHQQRLRAERLDEAKLALENDENVQQLIEQFGAVLDIDSIEPLD